MPVLLSNVDNSEIWFKQDDTFDKPCVFINAKIFIRDCDFGLDPIVNIYANLWKGMLEEHLRERSYMAKKAGIHESLVIHQGNI